MVMAALPHKQLSRLGKAAERFLVPHYEEAALPRLLNPPVSKPP